MSKQAKAKEAQGYTPKAVPSVCGNCGHFQSNIVERQYASFTWTEEKNIRCGIGGFAVKKMGACKLWKAKVTA